MDDREKVVEALEMSYKYSNVDENNALVPQQLVRDALALLKAQEPVKPTWYQVGRWFKTWRCGACGGTLVFRNGEDKPNYCTDCGRAVKWE